VDSGAVTGADEGRHGRGAEPLWGESWYFDFATSDASLGGFVRLGLYPNQGVVWYWAALVGNGRRLLLVHDHDMEAPRGAALEVRGQGLWSMVTCETPLDHWSIGLEAFAVALDDPAEAYRGERGDLVGLGFDLEWEALAPPFGQPGGYGQACRVTGEILVADEQLALDATGHRSHRWGVHDWWAGSRSSASGIFDDGTTFAACSGDEGVEIDATTDQDGLPRGLTITRGDSSIDATAVASAPLLLEAPDGRPARLARALCRYRSEASGSGTGWCDLLSPGNVSG
jgi:hypothetical protein